MLVGVLGYAVAAFVGLAFGEVVENSSTARVVLLLLLLLL